MIVERGVSGEEPDAMKGEHGYGDASDGRPVIDRRAIETLRALQRPGKADLVGRVVALFESESPKAIRRMCEGVASGDFDALRDAAHALKSSSAYVGALSLSMRCRDIESAAREADPDTCVALVGGLADDFEAALGELRPMLESAA